MEPDGILTKLYAGPAGAPLVVLPCHGEEGGAVYASVREQTDAPFSLLAVRAPHWNDDLTPWPAEPLRPGEAPFGGGADAFLERLTGELLPKALDGMETKPAYLALAGYSLAGLFALWAVYQTPLFRRAASVSGSLWYPGFLEFALGQEGALTPERLYFSLGDREAKTRQRLLRTVEDAARALERHWAARGCRTAFERNPGNHFQHAAERTARGVRWLLE